MSRRHTRAALTAAAEAIERQARWMRTAYPEPREKHDLWRIIATEDAAAIVRRMIENI